MKKQDNPGSGKKKHTCFFLKNTFCSCLVLSLTCLICLPYLILSLMSWHTSQMRYWTREHLPSAPICAVSCSIPKYQIYLEYRSRSLPWQVQVAVIWLWSAAVFFMQRSHLLTRDSKRAKTKIKRYRTWLSIAVRTQLWQHSGLFVHPTPPLYKSTSLDKINLKDLGNVL